MPFSGMRAYCPLWNRKWLGDMRLHDGCGRIFVYGPGLLNTPLNWGPGGVFSKAVLLFSDYTLLHVLGVEGLGDDKLYLYRVGPKYFHYDPLEYARGAPLKSCPANPSSLDARSLIHSSLLKVHVRGNPGSWELCRGNQTIIPLDSSRGLSVGFTIPLSVRRTGDTVEPPEYIDKSLAVEVYSAEAEHLILLSSGDSIETEILKLEVLHTDPEAVSGSEQPVPHLALLEYSRNELLRTVLVPLYGEEVRETYRRALILGLILELLVSKARPGPNGVTLPARDAKKIYKKLSRIVERYTNYKVEGGLQGLAAMLEPWITAGEEEILLTNHCRECGLKPRPGRLPPGLGVLSDAASRGLGIIL